MMRLPKFRYVAPKTLKEVAKILRDEGPQASILAGGTDLFPNMKRRQQTPKTVIGLREISELRDCKSGKDGHVMGPMMSLSDVVERNEFRETSFGFWRATKLISTPVLQNMGTLGGNLCLDTRCNYYDQNYEWRKAIDFCMKKDGEICWVAPSSPRCWAVSSTDAAPALMSLEAEVVLYSADGDRKIPLNEFYANDGIQYLNKKPDEVLAGVHLPRKSEWKSTYWKLRRRGSIDFPVLSVAAAVKLKKDVAEDVRIVLGAVTSAPLVSEAANEFLRGKKLTDDIIEEAAALAWKPARPLDNTDFHMSWRKTMVRRFVAGALKELRGDPVSSPTYLAAGGSPAMSLPSL